MASEQLQALPDAHPGLAGESIEKGKGDRYKIHVSNAKGYLCHIHMEVRVLSSLCLMLMSQSSVHQYLELKYHPWAPAFHDELRLCFCLTVQV